jgi:N-acetylglucosamine-6-phosphate deacetylase
MPDGLFELAGLPVHVRGGKAFLNNGTIAGSTVTLFECVKNMISWGVPAESAFKMATINPAKATKTQNICGSISVGKRADFILLNKDYSIKDVYVRGDLFR